MTCLWRNSIFDLHKWHLCLIAQRWVCTTESSRRLVQLVNVDWIYTGMLEIGVVVSSILFGILTMQIYFYHKNFSEDPPWIKLGLVSGCQFRYTRKSLGWFLISRSVVYGKRSSINTAKPHNSHLFWYLTRFIELTHTVCIAHEVYFYSVLHFGDTSTFNGWPVSFAIAAICHGVVAVLGEHPAQLLNNMYTWHFAQCRDSLPIAYHGLPATYTLSLSSSHATPSWW